MKNIMVNVLCILLWIALIAVIGFGDKLEQDKYTEYSELIACIENSEIAEIEMHEKSNDAYVTMKDGKEIITKIPEMEVFSTLVTEKIKSGEDLKFKVKPKSTFNQVVEFMTKVFNILLILIVFWDMYILWTSISNKITGNSQPESEGDLSSAFDIFETKNFATETTSNVKFSDVAGIDEEKQQLVEIVEFLKDPKKFQEMGAQVPKGVLLTGYPGTGKTLLARAIAGEAGVPFYQVTGSSFEEKFVGVGSSRVRSLFNKAKKHSPSIIFIDELDAVGVKRYSNSSSHNEQTLNQLLAEMDGFDNNTGVIVIAATNYVEVLDDAITRPGRFDRKVYIPMPDVSARKKILEFHAKSRKVSNNVSFDEIAKKTVGFSGAELQNLLNEAAILAVNRNAKSIEQEDIDEAFARVLVGLEKKDLKITEEDKYHTAVHEAGHAIVSMVLRPNVEVLSISIVPRGKSGGYNLFNNTEKTYYTKEDAIAEIQVAYGGKAAEEVILNKVSRGPEEDLKQASKIAKQMVMRYGMNDSLVTLVDDDKHFDSVLVEKNMDVIEKICQDAYKKTLVIIRNNENVLKMLAQELLEKEVMTSENVKKFKEENKFKLQ